MGKSKGGAGKNQHAAGPAGAAAFDVSRIIEGLKATRDVDVNLAALQSLQRALRSPQARQQLLQLMRHVPLLTELLFAVWDAQLKARSNPQLLVTLLTVMADMLHVACATLSAAAGVEQPAGPTHAVAHDGDQHSAQLQGTAAGEHRPSKKRKAEPPDEHAEEEEGSLQQPHTASKSQAAAPSGAADASALTLLTDSITRQLVGVKMRPMYHMLSSDNRHQANAALALLGAVARSSPAAARSLLAALDTQLSALHTLAKPPREVDAKGQPIPRPQYWKQWRAFSPLARPSRALLFDLVLSLISAADEALLTSKLLSVASGSATSAASGTGGGGGGGARSLVGALLAHCASDPPQRVLQLLQTLAMRVLGGDSQIPASVRSALWGDRALSQLAELASSSDSLDTQSVTEAVATAAQLAGQAAAEALLCVMTDPAQGLVGDPMPLDHTTTITAASGSTRVAEGTRRVMRALSRLRPAAHPLHASLLRGVATRQPALAAEFLGSQQLPLEPKVSSMWVAQVTLLSTIITQVIPAAAPASSLLTRLQSAAADMQQAATRSTAQQSAAPQAQEPDMLGSNSATNWPVQCSPPGVDSVSVRQWLRRCLPAALSKGMLSKGVSHPAPLVQLTTLHALNSCLQATRPVLSAVAEAAAAAASLASNSMQNKDASALDEFSTDQHISSSTQLDSPGGSLASAWASFVLKLRAAVKARLPDLALLLQLLHAADSSIQQTTAHATKSKQRQQANSHAGDDDADMEQQLLEHQQQIDDQLREEGYQEQGEGEEEDIAQLEQQVLQSCGVADKKVAAQLTGTGGVQWRADVLSQQVLQVLAVSAALLPDWVATAHLDPFKLLPAEPAALPLGSSTTAVAAANVTATTESGQQAEGFTEQSGHVSSQSWQHHVAGVLGKSQAWQQAWLALLDAMTSAAVTDQHAVAIGSSDSHVSCQSIALAGPASTAQLLSLLRLYTCAGHANVRANAGQLVLRFMLQSGIFTSLHKSRTTRASDSTTHKSSDRQAKEQGASILSRGGEALVWLWQLPQALLPSVAADGSVSQQLPILMASTAPASLLCDAIVTVTRRPHEAHALLLEGVASGTPPAQPGSGVVPAPAAASLGGLPRPLLAVALRSCLRACKSSAKTSPLDKAALANYLAGVLFHLARLLRSPQPLLAVLQHLLVAEWGTAALDDAQPQAGSGLGSGCSRTVQVPPHGQPLVSAYQQLLQLCGQPQHDGSNGSTQDQGKRMKRAQMSKGGTAMQDCEMDRSTIQFVSSSVSTAAGHEAQGSVVAAVSSTADTLLSESPVHGMDCACVQQALCTVQQAMSQQTRSNALQLGVSITAAVVARFDSTCPGSLTRQEGSAGKKVKRQKTQHAGAQLVRSATIADPAGTVRDGHHVMLAQLQLSLLLQPLQAHGLSLADVLPALKLPQQQRNRLLDDLLAAWLLHSAGTSQSDDSAPAGLSLDAGSAAQFLQLQVAPGRVLPHLHPSSALIAAALAASCTSQPGWPLTRAALHPVLACTGMMVHGAIVQPTTTSNHKQKHEAASEVMISFPAAQHLVCLISQATDMSSNQQLLPVAAALALACLDPAVKLHGCSMACSGTTNSSTDQRCGACQALKTQLLQDLGPLLAGMLMHMVGVFISACGKEQPEDHQPAGSQQQSAGQLTAQQMSDVLAQLLPVVKALSSQQLQPVIVQLLQYCQQAVQGPQHLSIAISVLRLAAHTARQAAAGLYCNSSSQNPVHLMQHVCVKLLTSQLQLPTTQNTSTAAASDILHVRAEVLQCTVSAWHGQHQNLEQAMSAGMLASVLVWPTPESVECICHIPRLRPILLPALHLCLQLGAQQQPLQHEGVQPLGHLHESARGVVKSPPVAALTSAALCDQVSCLMGLTQHHVPTAGDVQHLYITHRQRLALLLPLIRAYCSTSSLSDRANSEQPAATQYGSATLRGVMELVRDPLLAYAQRKRRKQSAGTNSTEAESRQGTTGTVTDALHTHAVPVLCACLEMLPLSHDEWHKLWNKLVPATGGWAAEPWLHAPEAGPGQQAALAAYLLTCWPGDKAAANGMEVDRQPGDVPQQEQYIACVAALMRACVTTLTACYKAAGKQQQQQGQGQGHSANGIESSSELLQVMMQQLGAVLDGALGDCIAGLGVGARQQPEFADLCQSAAALLSATLQYAGSDVICVRRVRRLLAALMPGEEDESEDGSQGEGKEEGGREVDSHTTDSESSEGDSTELSAAEDEEQPTDSASEGGSEGQLSSDEEQDHQQQHSDTEMVSAGEEEGEGAGASEDGEGGIVAMQGEQQAACQAESDDVDMADEGKEGEEEEEVESEEGQEQLLAGDTAGDEGDVQAADDMEQHLLQEALSQPALAEVTNICHPRACELINSMLGACVSHPVFLQGVTEASVPEALPAHVAALQVPCTSLAPLVTLISPQLVHVDSSAAAGHNDDTSSSMRSTGSSLRVELFMLLETLLGLRRVYQQDSMAANAVAHDDQHDRDTDSNSRSSSDDRDSHIKDSSQDRATDAAAGTEIANGHGCADDVNDAAAAAAPAWPASSTEAAALHKLLFLLLPTYQATLSCEDVACLRVLLLLDALVAAYECQDVGVSAMTVRLTGPLARAGYLWAAAAANAAADSSPANGNVVAAAVDAEGDAAVEQLGAQVNSTAVAAALRSHPDLLDARRVALACVTFPHSRTLLADDDDSALAPAARANADPTGVERTAMLPTAARGASSIAISLLQQQQGFAAAVPFKGISHDQQHSQQGPATTVRVCVDTPMVRAAADPAWMLPFCVTILRGGHVALPWLIRSGLLALCLRCLGSPDPILRAVAYEALGLFTERLEAVQKQYELAAAAGTGHGSTGSRTAHVASGRHPDDFRERAELLALLLQVRHSVSKPLQRLPACVALWAAEAACLLACAHSAPLAALRAARKAVLTTQAASFTPTRLPPALSRALVSAAPTARVEQLWASQLLLAGLVDHADAPLHRARYIPQLIMALMHSGLCLDRQAGSAAAGAATSSLPTRLATPALASVPGSRSGASAAGAGLQSNTAMLLAVVLRACSIPELAKYLVQHGGVVPWLAAVAAHYIACIPVTAQVAQPAAAGQGTPAQQDRHVERDIVHSSLSVPSSLALMVVEALHQLVRGKVGCPANLAVAQRQQVLAGIQGQQDRAPLAHPVEPKLGAAGHAFLHASQQLVSALRGRLHLSTGSAGIGSQQQPRCTLELLAVVQAIQQLGAATLCLAPHMAGCHACMFGVDQEGHVNRQGSACWCQHLHTELQHLHQQCLPIT